MDRLFPSIEFKAQADTSGHITGYASTFFDTPDSFGDVVARGAFLESISQRMPAMLWSHDSNQPLGKWAKISEDSKGLYVEGKLTLAIPKAQEVRALSQDDALSFSIGYRALEWEDLSQGRILKKIDLFEISFTAVPANPNARIIEAKAIELDSRVGLEKAIRGLGLSKSKTRALMAAGYKALAAEHEQAAQEEEMADLATKLSDLSQLLIPR